MTLKKRKKIILLEEFDTRILEVVLALISALEFREPYTVGHSERVTMYGLKIAKEIGFSPARLNTLRYAGLLHDIGKIGVNENILNKKGKLTIEEFEEVKKHPIIAKSILNPISGLKDVIPIIYHHHERWDGKGYPAGLKGKLIPLESRIISIADTFDALTSDRPYRKRLTKEKAIEILIAEKYKQFDGELVECFINILRKKNV